MPVLLPYQCSPVSYEELLYSQGRLVNDHTACMFVRISACLWYIHPVYRRPTPQAHWQCCQGWVLLALQIRGCSCIRCWQAANAGSQLSSARLGKQQRSSCSE